MTSVTVRLCRCALGHRHMQMRHLYQSSRLEKKQYDYDLDSLVKWKQETNMLFGPQRKPTKTGKLKKTKKEPNKQVLQNIELLSSISNNDIHKSSEIINKTPISLELQEGNLSELKDHPTDFEQAVPYSEKTKSKRTNLKEFKIKKVKMNDVHNSDPEYENNLVSPSVSYKLVDPSSSEVSVDEQFTSVSAERTLSFRSQEKNVVEKEKNDIEIPKIEPVPLGKEKVSSNKSLMPTMNYPPIEAPLSFDIVSSFPLKPQGMSNNVTAQQLHMFKMDVESMALRFLPSVKTVLNKTMSDISRFLLNRWREGMINELGEEGFQKYKNETMRQGTNLHANVMEFLSGKQESELQIMPENEGHWASLHTALQSVSDIQALEMDVLHPSLLYRGVFDCVARYKDLLCVIDWKVSKKPKPLLKNTYDDPLQVAAYAGALNATSDYVKQFGEMNHGLIVVAYHDGSPAHMHMLNRDLMEQYWQDWTARLHSFYVLTYTERFAQKQQADKI